MPYIPNDKFETGDGIRSKTAYMEREQREYLDECINELAKRIGRRHKEYGYDGAFLGLVNYSVTRLVTRILLDNFDRPRYWHSPAIRGVMQDIGDELYRRVFVPYEDIQIENTFDEFSFFDLGFRHEWHSSI